MSGPGQHDQCTGSQTPLDEFRPARHARVRAPPSKAYMPPLQRLSVPETAVEMLAYGGRLLFATARTLFGESRRGDISGYGVHKVGGEPFDSG